VTLTEYDKDLPVDAAYPYQEFEACLGEVISEAGLKQLRIAETERYAHITNFLNGMCDQAFPGEDRVIIPSPNVSKYEQEPEMSTAAIADRVIKEIALGEYDAIMVNLAAPDLVAQSGEETATIKACEAVDKALGKIVDAALAVGGALLLVSDHGHAEVVRDPATDKVVRTGTKNPVPFLAIGKSFEGIKAPSGDVVGGDLALTAQAGTLRDVAPTMLHILGLPIPPEMTGRKLV
jgi:2,3-bisphosphoglycerate-independent phosphoglycerate mutase